jgi:hypothetical protein
VDQAGHEALEQLALTEDDHGLVAGACLQVVVALGRLAQPDQVEEQLGTAGKEEAGGRERRSERDRSDRDVYGERTLRSSAVMAGTISVRSPITA